MMPTRPSIERGVLPWLWLSALAATAPHAIDQAGWLNAFAATLLALVAWRWWRHAGPLPRWLPPLIALSGGTGIWLTFGTLFGREAGVALLVLFMAMKFLELRSKRDAMVIVALGNFLLLTHYFQNQDILTGLWLLFTFWLLTASLVRLHGGPDDWRANLRQAGMLAIQAVPFMIALFLLFPRIDGPLWGLPADAHAGRTGLSEDMAPGSIAQLARSDEIAFRVSFAGPIPPRARLYWRGPVLENFDGRRWLRHPRQAPVARVIAEGPGIAYESTLEANQQRWLMALDAPLAWPASARLDSRLSVVADKPLEARQRLRMQAALDYRFNVEEDPRTLAVNLALPAKTDPRTRRLAESWRNQAREPARIVALALRHFREEAFHYTLTPPLLGDNGIDQFLFETRRGFCEHYAAAFVVLMRAAGVPARVVTGYQGGEINPRDGYLTVRQSDAHAWAEVWLENRGWQRVDPTAAVSPLRIELGIAGALPPGEPLPPLLRLGSDWLRELRFGWEALNNAWNQQVLGYDTTRQRELLQRLGWPDADWRSLGLLLGGALSTLLALSAALILLRRPRPVPEIRLWHRALRRLRVDCAPGETPHMLLARLHEQSPHTAECLAPVVAAYIQARYGPPTKNTLADLRLAVDRLPRWRLL
ncbi:DUF3488 and transglutaminase-like domain-containing protein [Azonexus sp. R2A61]|uniref:transglutaminase TgpA family protein n=1 Tax=Azonexus sp. R2A61 TaxID=2744443 RepID=UPI001F379B6B|nr:DUF3488 and transglutaminase-like domain-containing protein [Azonexus sp. R2A61]